MSKFFKADIVGGMVKIGNRKIDKVDAMRRIKSGDSVYGNRSEAKTLAASLTDGQGYMQDAAHVLGGYRHFHDLNHRYNGHIFYGQPVT